MTFKNNFKKLDRVAISIKSHKVLQKIFEENPFFKDMLLHAESVEEAIHDLNKFAKKLLSRNKYALAYAESQDSGQVDMNQISWQDFAAIRLFDYTSYSGIVLQDQNIRGDFIESHPVKYLWLAAKTGKGGALIDFFQDFLMLFRQLNGTLTPQVACKDQINVWMERHPSGLDERIMQIRDQNKERIIKLIVKKIDEGKLSSNKFRFEEGMSELHKVKMVFDWWNDHNFHLRFAVRNPDLLNEMLNGSIPVETMTLLNDAHKAGIPFFINPYYLSLLNVTEPGFAVGSDLAIRDYIMFSKQLIKEFGHIVAWEKEDQVEEGKPNAAGWILPRGSNIHRRYPEVAILIPDTAGRACGGLCVSCQRMYDFQSGRLNFDLDKLLPKENWAEKLERLMQYFEKDPQLCDILITGGDALMSSDKSLRIILEAVFQMAKRKYELNLTLSQEQKLANIRRIRLGTRLPVYIPQRITPQLTDLLAEFRQKGKSVGIKQFVIQTHFETAMEVTPEVVKSIQALVGAGWLVTNQHVFTASSSRRGHLSKLRAVLSQNGVLPYYNFSVKGYHENSHNFSTNARILQELNEEKIHGQITQDMKTELNDISLNPETIQENIVKLLEKSAILFLSCDRSVLNLPGVGKSLTFRTIGITRHGRRVLLFNHDHTRNHSQVVNKMGKVFIVESKSISQYLRQLEEMGEETDEYQSIFGYSISETESQYPVFAYPKSQHQKDAGIDQLG